MQSPRVLRGLALSPPQRAAAAAIAPGEPALHQAGDRRPVRARDPTGAPQAIGEHPERIDITAEGSSRWRRNRFRHGPGHVFVETDRRNAPFTGHFPCSGASALNAHGPSMLSVRGHTDLATELCIEAFGVPRRQVARLRVWLEGGGAARASGSCCGNAGPTRTRRSRSPCSSARSSTPRG